MVMFVFSKLYLFYVGPRFTKGSYELIMSVSVHIDFSELALFFSDFLDEGVRK